MRDDMRGKGLMEKLTLAAAKHAKRNGADLVEVFPVRDTALDGCDGFQGIESTLARCGFETIARPSARRAYMRQELSRGATRGERRQQR